MADEAVALEEVEEETSVLDFLANQSEEVGDELEEEPEVESEDIDVLKERVSKRNKSLKKSKQAIHRLQDEGAERDRLSEAQDKRIEELEAKLSQPTQDDAGAKKQEQEEALAYWKTEISDNPERSIDFINWSRSNDKAEFVQLADNMEKSFTARLSELEGRTNPERIKYRGDMDKLRQTFPELSGLDDDVAFEVAKAMSKKKTPRGSPSGQKVSKQPTPDERLKELTKKYDDFNTNG